MKEIVLVLNGNAEDKAKLVEAIGLFGDNRLKPLKGYSDEVDSHECNCKKCRKAEEEKINSDIAEELKGLSLLELKEILILSKVLSQTKEDINKSIAALEEVEGRMAILESILISIGVDEDSINSVINLLF